MIIAVVIAAGFLVLLIAPSLHRRSIQKSRDEAAAKKVERAESFRRERSTEEHVLETPADAVRARDALMLQGVRSEVITGENGTVLLAANEDRPVVLEILRSLR